jgi:hypothetical protein
MTPRFTRFGTLCGALAMVCLLTTAPAQATHPRPKSASPMRMSLVPAYAACAAPNRTHGPPLAFASCNPPAQTSAQATVGTPDAFGGAANSAGSLRLAFICCGQAPDDLDILVQVEVNDVRCRPTGSRCGTANASGPADYSGDIRLAFTVRLTDHFNALAPGGGTDAATVQDFAIKYNNTTDGIPGACAQTASTSTGSTCSSNTSLNAVIPGSLKEAKRAIYELDAVRIFDGGADGDGGTTADNTVFMRPGVFIP